MLETGQKVKRRHQRHSWFIKRQVILEFREGGKTMLELSNIYGIPHQTICDWNKKFGNDIGQKNTYLNPMTPEEQKEYDQLKEENERLKQAIKASTNVDLEQQNIALKKDLEYARLKALAMETLVDLAKTELGIDLRKNSGARQPVRSGTTTPKQP